MYVHVIPSNEFETAMSSYRVQLSRQNVGYVLLYD